ncbi:MAG: hypothetical protein TE42_04670 [Candidatus Synechococcus spongiarum SP3]|uniref:Uncharacterized protein n=1 Tax=Candidatus Synechococcus spongiarum SP3 TaxID=1604020 RepID=A0A0G2HMA1_9SYNE|nr:MAG: hypothetical protein TE42_04670 [Candidatus Synechococcus spongiarum SP3]
MFILGSGLVLPVPPLLGTPLTGAGGRILECIDIVLQFINFSNAHVTLFIYFIWESQRIGGWGLKKKKLL